MIPEAKFDWGDAVRVSARAQQHFHPNKAGSVCGYRAIETDGQAKRFGFPVATVLWLVEFGDGNAIEIPEPLLERNE